jgi:hypothetical protein
MSDLRHTVGVICLTGHRAEETQDAASLLESGVATTAEACCPSGHCGAE